MSRGSCRLGQYLDPKEKRCRNIDVGGANWDWKFDGKKNNFSLHDPLGWRWDGEDDQATGFLIRIMKSKVKGEFIQQMKELGLTPRDVKMIFLRSAKEGDGLYQMSGDNVVWRHGEIEGFLPDESGEIEYLTERFDVSEEEAKKIVEESTGEFSIDYDEYEKERKEGWAKDMKKALEESDDWEQLDKKITSDGLTLEYIENVQEYVQEKFSGALRKNIKQRKLKERK